jgi:hypothetical protein
MGPLGAIPLALTLARSGRVHIRKMYSELVGDTGFEPVTSSVSGKTWRWLDGACCGWVCRLPAYSVAGRGLVSADDGGRWLLGMAL